eukprot:CAMPEP_0194356056 /NCGR_PEP_ID=MMETSP0174-20130528/3852_1 /TAXON_ID=216777 /ORGANISM="Proboscia alata, Strain PI-D3" /LENGTH=124 /DNA_ID=CAMNT_0039125561 /DNA_START=215 /DNA_END=589 /DNA_ORIENTATION=-
MTLRASDKILSNTFSPSSNRLIALAVDEVVSSSSESFEKDAAAVSLSLLSDTAAAVALLDLTPVPMTVLLQHESDTTTKGRFLIALMPFDILLTFHSDTSINVAAVAFASTLGTALSIFTAGSI